MNVFPNKYSLPNGCENLLGFTFATASIVPTRKSSLAPARKAVPWSRSATAMNVFPNKYSLLIGCENLLGFTYATAWTVFPNKYSLPNG